MINEHQGQRGRRGGGRHQGPPQLCAYVYIYIYACMHMCIYIYMYVIYIYIYITIYNYI